MVNTGSHHGTWEEKHPLTTGTIAPPSPNGHKVLVGELLPDSATAGALAFSDSDIDAAAAEVDSLLTGPSLRSDLLENEVEAAPRASNLRRQLDELSGAKSELERNGIDPLFQDRQEIKDDTDDEEHDLDEALACIDEEIRSVETKIRLEQLDSEHRQLMGSLNAIIEAGKTDPETALARREQGGEADFWTMVDRVEAILREASPRVAELEGWDDVRSQTELENALRDVRTELGIAGDTSLSKQTGDGLSDQQLLEQEKAALEDELANTIQELQDLIQAANATPNNRMVEGMSTIWSIYERLKEIVEALSYDEAATRGWDDEQRIDVTKQFLESIREETGMFTRQASGGADAKTPDNEKVDNEPGINSLWRWDQLAALNPEELQEELDDLIQRYKEFDNGPLGDTDLENLREVLIMQELRRDIQRILWTQTVAEVGETDDVWMLQRTFIPKLRILNSQLGIRNAGRYSFHNDGRPVVIEEYDFECTIRDYIAAARSAGQTWLDSPITNLVDEFGQEQDPPWDETTKRAKLADIKAASNQPSQPDPEPNSAPAPTPQPPAATQTPRPRPKERAEVLNKKQFNASMDKLVTKARKGSHKARARAQRAAMNLINQFGDNQPGPWTSGQKQAVFDELEARIGTVSHDSRRMRRAANAATIAVGAARQRDISFFRRGEGEVRKGRIAVVAGGLTIVAALGLTLLNKKYHWGIDINPFHHDHKKPAGTPRTSTTIPPTPKEIVSPVNPTHGIVENLTHPQVGLTPDQAIEATKRMGDTGLFDGNHIAGVIQRAGQSEPIVFLNGAGDKALHYTDAALKIIEDVKAGR